jgi:hypothetical protein
VYKGWIKSSLAFQKTIGFSYQGKHHRRNKYYKFFNVEVTDDQYLEMKSKWKHFKEDIQWDLRKKVDEAFGIKEGDLTASILNGKRYFFNRYSNLNYTSKLREWTKNNGLYVYNREKYIYEGYIALKAHIAQDGSTCSEHEQYIEKLTRRCDFDESDIDTYIDDLLIIKNKLKEFK